MGLFGFGVASSLYDQAAHPRVLLGADDLPRLREATRRGVGKRLLDHLSQPAQRRAQAILEAGDKLGDIVAGRDRRNTDVRADARQLGFVGLMTDDHDMLEAAKLALLASAGDQRIDPLGYDFVQPLLSPAERKQVVGVMVKDLRVRMDSRGPAYFANPAHNLTMGFAFGGIWSLLAVRNDPEAPDLTAETDTLIKRYEASLYTCIHRDGYPEEDIGYGTSVAGSLIELGEALRRAGLFDPWTYEGTRNFGRAMLHFVQPWGEAVANTGDHGSTFRGREFSLPRVASETGDPAVRWLAGALDDAYVVGFNTNVPPGESPNTVPWKQGLKLQASMEAILALDDLDGPIRKPGSLRGKATPATAYLDRTRGIMSFRSGWGEDDAFLVVDASHRSPAGQGHWHDSAGHFSFSALGELFAIDTGRYNHEQTEHNVVLAGGRPGHSNDGQWIGSRYSGRLMRYVTDPFCDVAGVDMTVQSNCYWAWRHVGLVKGEPDRSWAWTVDDVNLADDWAAFDWQLQTCPENRIQTLKNSATITGCRHGAMMDVHTILPTRAEYPQPHGVTYVQDEKSTCSYAYVKDPEQRAAEYEPARRRMAYGPAFVRPRLIARVEGWNGRFLTVMIPRRRGDAKPKVRSLPTLPTSFAVEVNYGDVRDVLIFAHEHHLLEADGIVGRGRWCVVRRNADNRVIRTALGEGWSLEVDGQPIKI